MPLDSPIWLRTMRTSPFANSLALENTMVTREGDRPVMFALSGHLAFRGSDDPAVVQVENEYEILSRLQKLQGEIADEIRHALEIQTRSRFVVDIQFRSGSIEWIGIVEATVSWLSDVGGVIALTQLIAAAVNAAVYRHARTSKAHPLTQVTAMSVPQIMSEAGRNVVSDPATPTVAATAAAGPTVSPRAVSSSSLGAPFDRALLLALLGLQLASFVILLWLVTH